MCVMRAAVHDGVLLVMFCVTYVVIIVVMPLLALLLLLLLYCGVDGCFNYVQGGCRFWG